ncbi:MAG: PilZ domain-containing protein [Planctomycetales bacterium]|nr:PilZ domain-containing protein [Planctomycetales bacterium]
METLTLTSQETLQSDAIRDFLLQACREQSPVIASYLYEGKWHLLELKGFELSDQFAAFNIQTPLENLKPCQPVGICVHLGYFKYLFDTSVAAIETQGPLPRILLDFPDRVERIERRMYHRQPVPAAMKVKVMFWHRGYMDDCDEKPRELYWEGRLLNLSVAGAQFETDMRQKDNFKVGQLLGVQFTPMSYQIPLLLESYVRYLKDLPDNGHFRIGVEFLGLEASPEGRDVLARIRRIVSAYEAMNNSDCSASDGPPC